MDLTYLLDKYEVSLNKLLYYGFKLIDNYYLLIVNSSLYQNMVFKIKITSSIEVRCFDKDLEDEYLPFNLVNPRSEIATKLKDEVITYLSNIFDQAFSHLDLNKVIIDSALNNLSSYIDHPFNKYPTYTTFKRKDNHKWFAILMDIPLNKLTKDKRENIVSVLNIKVDPKRVPSLINNINYFKAYHMNSKYRISILINKDINLEKVFELIKRSFELVG